MLLDDSLEVDGIPPSGSGAELLPMLKGHDVQLSNIWIPSELLLNRQCLSQTSSNVHQSVICRTLEKHNVVDSLSIYNESEIQKSFLDSSEKLVDSLEELAKKCLNTKQTHFQEANERKTYSYSNSELALNINENKVKNDACLEEKCDSSDDNDSTKGYLDHLNFSDDEEENSSIGIIYEPDKTETCILDYPKDEKVLESFSNEISTKPVCDMLVETDTCPQIVQDSASDSFPSSDQTEDKFEVSQKLWNLDLKLNNELNASEIPIRPLDYANDAKVFESCGDEIVKADTCPLATEVVQDSLNVPFSSPDQKEDIFEVSERLWNDKLNNENSSAGGENLLFANQTDGIHDTLGSTIPEQSSELSEGPSGLIYAENHPDETTEVQHFTFLLQKSKGEDLSTLAGTGKNNKKEKKLKKKAPKTIPLDNFFLNKKEAASSDSGYLAYRESLRLKFGDRDTSKKSEPDWFLQNSTDFYAINEPRYPENTMNCATNSVSDHSSSSTCNVDSTLVDSNLTKYVIENIPPSVDEEMLQSLIATYPDIVIKNIVMMKSEKTQKARIEVSLEDPNWLIECLNETQPFGASSDCLKCFQIL